MRRQAPFFLDTKYDVVVAGGSIAGLAFAGEAAMRGLQVLLAEEHPVIGEPEKCDGLVSLRGLRENGHVPGDDVIQSRISSATVHSPLGREFTVNAKSLEVVVLDRRRYDRQAFDTAKMRGATVELGRRVTDVRETDGEVSAKVGGRRVRAAYYVDATGPASSPRSGIIPAAKYEIEAGWVEEGVVEVFLDAAKYPGFFAWVIPYGGGRAKVGAAGQGIDAFAALDQFLSKGPYNVLRKVAAPVYVGGPARTFVDGRKILVGESAGQVKPTTAGGISTSVAGAVMCAKWLCKALDSGDPSLLSNYQLDWEARFLKEMKNMSRLRNIFEKLSNKDIDSLVSAVSTPRHLAKLSRSDFDFHASGLLGALGVSGLLRVAKVVASAEVKSLLTGDEGLDSQQPI